MKTVCSFVAKFASLILWKLSCFDRVIFKGHLPFSYAAKFEAFVDYILKMRRADFMEFTAPAWSERLVEHAKAFADKWGRLYEYYQHGTPSWTRPAAPTVTPATPEQDHASCAAYQQLQQLQY